MIKISLFWRSTGCSSQGDLPGTEGGAEFKGLILSQPGSERVWHTQTSSAWPLGRILCPLRLNFGEPLVLEGAECQKFTKVQRRKQFLLLGSLEL